MRATAAKVARTITALAVLQAAIAGAVIADVSESCQPVCPLPGYTILGCPVRTDAVIRSSVLIRLAGLAKPPYFIEVGVQDSQVTLTGRVADSGVRDVASIMAGSVRGIRRLSNEVEVSPATTSDVEIVGGVTRYLGKATLGIRHIQVQCVDGIVRLTGMVQTDWARDQAGMIANSVAGVLAVQNNLIVQGPGENF